MTDLHSAVKFVSEQPGRFLEAWLGPAPPADVRRLADERLPTSIQRWHQEVGRWGHKRVTRQNQVPTRPEYQDDLLLVGIETQAVWLWAIDETASDPTVLERHNAEGEKWSDTGEDLDEFLWHFTLVEAVFGGEHGLGINNVDASECARFVAGWNEVATQPWLWPGPDSRLWVTEQAIAWTFANEMPGTRATPESYYAVFVAAPSREALSALRIHELAWDFDGRT